MRINRTNYLCGVSHRSMMAVGAVATLLGSGIPSGPARAQNVSTYKVIGSVSLR